MVSDPLTYSLSWAVFFVCFLFVFIAVRVNEKNQKMLVRQSPVRHA